MTGRLADQLMDDLLNRRPLRQPDIVDAHAHLGPYSLFHIPDPDPASMIAVMALTGVRTAAISANLGIQLDAAAGNRQVLAAAERYPDQFLPVGVVNPWQQPEETIAAIEADRRFVAIKVHPDLARYPLSGRRFREVFEFAELTGCPVLTHSWESSPYDSPSIVEQTAEAYPNAKIIMGHAGGTATGVEQTIAVAGRQPNVFLEICGSEMTSTALRQMVAGIGARRVLFGSDFPFIDQRFSLGRVVIADLDEADLRAILGANARRLFDWRRQAGDEPDVN